MTDSDDIAARLSETLATWLAEQGGGFVSSFTMCAEYVDSDGDRSWLTAHHDGQTPSQTLGLLRWHTLNAEHQCVGLMFAEDE